MKYFFGEAAGLKADIDTLSPESLANTRVKSAALDVISYGQ